jgi:uncharacterized protein
MLLVKTEVKNSLIAGMGLFAGQDIKKGEVVWQYTPDTCNILTKDQFQTLLDSFHKTEKQLIEYFLTYTYYQDVLKGLIFCLDNGRYVNHSDQPNLSGPSDMSSEVSWQYSIALRDIAKGEELFENYGTYDTCEWLEEICKSYRVYHLPEQAPV